MEQLKTSIVWCNHDEIVVRWELNRLQIAWPEASVTNCNQNYLVQSAFWVFDQFTDWNLSSVLVANSQVLAVATERELLAILEQFSVSDLDQLSIARVLEHANLVLSDHLRAKFVVMQTQSSQPLCKDCDLAESTNLFRLLILGILCFVGGSITVCAHYWCAFLHMFIAEDIDDSCLVGVWVNDSKDVSFVFHHRHVALKNWVALKRLYLLEGLEAKDVKASTCRHDQDFGLDLEKDDWFVEAKTS